MTVFTAQYLVRSCCLSALLVGTVCYCVTSMVGLRAIAAWSSEIIRCGVACDKNTCVRDRERGGGYIELRVVRTKPIGWDLVYVLV